MKNPDYKAEITLSKGGKQLVNIITSTAFSAFIVVVYKELTDKDFKPENLKYIIDNLSNLIVFITPFMSMGIKMITNFVNNYTIKK